MKEENLAPLFEAHHDEKVLVEERLRAVRLIIAALNSAFKKLSLYSGAHSLYQGALTGLKASLNDFYERFGELRFELSREQICCDGRVVSEGKPERSDLWYVLHRDGILWICFVTSPELWELDTFLQTCKKYLNPDENDEDDVVTALWEFEMPSIQYEAADLELNDAELLDFAQLPCVDPQGAAQTLEAAPEEDEPAGLPAPSGAESLALNDDCLWVLTSDERRQLRQMVAETEVMDGAVYVSDVLLTILDRQAFPAPELDGLLDLLRDELSQMLAQGRCTCFYGALCRIGERIKVGKVQQQEMAPALSAFVETLAEKNFLGILNRQPEWLERSSREALRDLKKALLLLGGAALPALGGLLAEVQTGRLRKLLMEAVVSIARWDYRPLEKLLADCAEHTAVQLVPLLAYLTDPRSRQTLTGLLSHDAEQVRRLAVKALIARDAGSLKEIFALIDDPDPRIRTLILDHLAQQRSEAAEALLLDYLKDKQFKRKDCDMLYAVCRTLGKCGSDRSIAFLEQHLNVLPLLGSNRKVRRKAALLALQELRTERAEAVIEKSAGSLLGRLF